MAPQRNPSSSESALATTAIVRSLHHFMASSAPLRAPLPPQFHIIPTLLIFCAHLTFRGLPSCPMLQCSPRSPHAFPTHFCSFWCVSCPGISFERLTHLHIVHRAHSTSCFPLFALVRFRTDRKLFFTFLHPDAFPATPCTGLPLTRNGEYSAIHLESTYLAHFLPPWSFCELESF
jgi:hypothetical protein